MENNSDAEIIAKIIQQIATLKTKLIYANLTHSMTRKQLIASANHIQKTEYIAKNLMNEYRNKQCKK